MTTDAHAQALAIRAVWAAGREAWPDLALDEATFARWLGPRLAPGQDPRALVAADLFLVGACLCGVPDAARRFVEGPLAATERHVARIVGRPDAVAELLQDMAAHLMTPGADGAPPRLAQYTGRGALAVWLRMTAMRRAINLGRNKTKVVDFDAVAFEQVSEHDPELSVLRRRHKQEIAAIFREAIAGTSRDDRMLLRLHYVQGSTLNELAVVFRTSRSSMHRRVESARAELLARIAELVRARLHLSTSDQASMLRVFKSDLRDSLGVLLDSDETAA